MGTTQIRGSAAGIPGQIQSNTIANLEIASAAAIALTKLAKVPITPDGATAFTAAQSMGNFGLTNLATPVASTDAANKSYVDLVAQGLSAKMSVRVLAAANIALSGTQTIDGVALSAGDTVLCIGQTTGSANGSYVVAAGAWARTNDFNGPEDQTRSPYWFVGEGSTYAASGWVMTTWPYTIGTTALVFTQFTGAGEIVAGNGLAKSGNTLSIDTNVTVDKTTAQTLTNKSIAATQLTGTLQAAQFPALTGDVTTPGGSLATTIAAGAVTYAKMANVAGQTVIGNSSGSPATPAAVVLSSLNTSNSLMYRDGNSNVLTNNLIEAMTSTATAAGTTTLTVASAKIQQFTGSSTQTVVLPDATLLQLGHQFEVMNRSSGIVTVNMNGGSLLQSMATNTFAVYTLIAKGSSAGTWDVAYTAPGGNGTVTTLSVVTANGFQGTVANASTTPAITLQTSAVGMLKGAGNALVSAVPGTDFMAPADFVVRETPSGTINGSNVNFTLANMPLSNTEQVFLNGVLQEPGSGNDYTIAGTALTMITIPQTGDRLRVTYYK